MSKGSGRRPMQISQEELDKRWEAVFNGKPADFNIITRLIDEVIKNIPNKTTNNKVLYSTLYSSSSSLEYFDISIIEKVDKRIIHLK